MVSGRNTEMCNEAVSMIQSSGGEAYPYPVTPGKLKISRTFSIEHEKYGKLDISAECRHC